MKKRLTIIIALFSCICFYACETSDDISNGLDHEVPSYKVLTDSLIAQAGQTVEIKVDVSDNAGLSKLVLSYGNWLLRESVSLEELNFPQSYRFTASVTIPENAEKEWTEDWVRNDGTTVKINQVYHTLNLEVTDINMNVRNVPIYIQIK